MMLDNEYVDYHVGNIYDLLENLIQALFVSIQYYYRLSALSLKEILSVPIYTIYTVEIFKC